MQRSQCSSKFF